MHKFFEAIVSGTQNGPLLAAWIIQGPAAGAGAVFRPEENGCVLQYRDESFPAGLAGEICGLPPETAGILEREGRKIFLERIYGRKKLVICGAGHVALSVIRISIMLGFEVTVIEDRAEYADKARVAGAHHVLCSPFTEALDGIPGDLSTAFAVMTREHVHDTDCLRKILGKPYAYAGMMGSRSRTEQVRKQMTEEGFDPQKVAQLHMPIGLPIGSRTPEEIAVSVAAELIRVTNASDPGEGFPFGLLEEMAGEAQGVLAMIVKKDGEAPRRPGTKMLVRSDGSFLGTVGGGYAEAAILRMAGQMIREGCRESRLATVSMDKGTMRCGGEVTVFLMPLQDE